MRAGLPDAGPALGDDVPHAGNGDTAHPRLAKLAERYSSHSCSRNDHDELQQHSQQHRFNAGINWSLHCGLKALPRCEFTLGRSFCESDIVNVDSWALLL